VAEELATSAQTDERSPKGGIALSESSGTIFAPDERRLGARVSPERLR